MAKLAKRPYKSKLFDVYVKWKSIPAICRGFQLDSLEKIGIDEIASSELLSIKTQAEFATKYDVDTGTLSDWNKRIHAESLVEPFRLRSLEKILGNALISFGFTVAKNPTPYGIKVLDEIVSKKKKEMPEDDVRSPDFLHRQQIDRILDLAYGDNYVNADVLKERERAKEELETTLETLRQLDGKY